MNIYIPLDILRLIFSYKSLRLLSSRFNIPQYKFTLSFNHNNMDYKMFAKELKEFINTHKRYIDSVNIEKRSIHWKRKEMILKSLSFVKYIRLNVNSINDKDIFNMQNVQQLTIRINCKILKYLCSSSLVMSSLTYLTMEFSYGISYLRYRISQILQRFPCLKYMAISSKHINLYWKGIIHKCKHFSTGSIHNLKELLGYNEHFSLIYTHTFVALPHVI